MKYKVLLLVLPMFLSLVQGVSAATFEFSNYPKLNQETCVYTADIYIDTQGELANAMDIEIRYNPEQVTVVDADSSEDGLQIVPGNAFSMYFANIVNSDAGIIRLGAASLTDFPNGRFLLASIIYQTQTRAEFSIWFDGVGETLDSNIASGITSNDLLTGVINADYTIGECFDGESDTSTTMPIADEVKIDAKIAYVNDANVLGESTSVPSALETAEEITYEPGSLGMMVFGVMAFMLFVQKASLSR